MDNIINQIEEDIFKEPLGDLVIDYLDIGLDAVTDSEIIDCIPVVKTIATICKTGISIKERFFAKKMLIFASEIRKGDVSEEKFELRRKALANNEKWIKKEIEDIIIYIDRYDRAEKAQMHAILYRGYINNKISNDKYLNMLAVIEEWHKADNGLLEKLYEIHKKNEFNSRDYVIMTDSASAQRIEALGILHIKREVVDLEEEFGPAESDDEYGCPFALREELSLNYAGILLGEILFDKEIYSSFDEEYFDIVCV